MENPFYLLLVPAGLFSVCGALFDWEFFFTNHRARPFVAMFGRTGARIFYFLLGAGIAIMGVLLATGILKNS